MYLHFSIGRYLYRQIQNKAYRSYTRNSKIKVNQILSQTRWVSVGLPMPMSHSYHSELDLVEAGVAIFGSLLAERRDELAESRIGLPAADLAVLLQLVDPSE